MTEERLDPAVRTSSKPPPGMRPPVTPHVALGNASFILLARIDLIRGVSQSVWSMHRTLAEASSARADLEEKYTVVEAYIMPVTTC